MAELVLTRPRAQAGDWLRRLAEQGVRALSLPLIEIEPGDGQQAEAAWDQLPGAALAMFVSPNAVTSFFEKGQAWPAGVLAACVGPGSAAALREAGVPEALIVQPPPDAASLDSEHLWPELEQRRDWTGQRVLFLRGEGGRDWLAERLRERGALTSYFSVYRRRRPVFSSEEQALFAKILAAPQSHVWLFSSAEAVGHLGALAPAGQDWSAARCICTHPRIAEAARALGFGHVVSARPDAAAVAAAWRGGDLESSPL